MTLFSTMQIASNALQAAQIGLQVTGNNVANANTPGYIREEVVFTPAPTQRFGGLLLGTGVDVDAVKQKTDRFLEERLREASSDVASAEALEKNFTELESLIGELSDTDLSSVIDKFFNSIHDILNQPDSLSVRNVAIRQGERLTDDIRRLDSRVRDVRRETNDRITNSAADINRLLEKIAKLNVQITTFEGGDVSGSDAVGLRDQRSQTVNELAQLVHVKAFEQTNGSLTLFAGGDYIVHEGQFREVAATFSYDRGQTTTSIHIKETDSPLDVSSGEVYGLTQARDSGLGTFLDKLSSFARALSFEFNKAYSSGQGLTGYSDLTSEFGVADTTVALDVAGLPYTPINGSFQLQVYNKQTKTTQTTDVIVRLNGLDDDTTLTSLASTLNAIDGVTVTITPDRKLKIVSDSDNLQFAFAKDTSGTLASLGLNTFFSGSTSSDISVNSTLLDDPSKFAISQTGIGKDTENGIVLAGLQNTALETQNGLSLANLYDNFIGDTTQAAGAAHATAEGYRVFHATLDAQLQSLSGVSVDEEAVKMILFQRAFQASARFIRTVSELLETLVNL